MPITYTPALNRITITGYALGAECTFTDVYNADKAGTFSLHARVGVAAVDGAPVAVTNALRPTDYVVLGGASGDLYITIANWNLMTNATIQIVGTDRDGAAQTENIAVIGNGNYNTTMWFKTITSTQITVFNTPGGGTFDYDLIQGQWGVVWKTGNQFYFQAYIRLGVGVTWFADTAKQVEFDPALATAGAAIFTIHWSSHLRLGTLIDATLKTSRDGCSITCLGVSGWFDLITCAGDGTVELYSSTFTSSTQNCQVQARSSSRVWNCLFIRAILAWPFNSDIFNSTVCEQMGLRTPTNTTVDRLSVFNTTTAALQFQNVAGQAANNVYARGNWVDAWGTRPIYMNGVTFDVDLLNPDLNFWYIDWGGGSTGDLYRKYEIDLKVVDSDGVGIAGATVSMLDQFGAAVFSVATDVNGDIARQTVTYGYYDLANGNTIQPAGSYSPHLVTISKPGYTTRTIRYTMDRKREEIEKLGLASPHGLEYRRRRVPGEVSAMGGQGIG